MAHRHYVYNIDYTKEIQEELLVGEWNYDIPLFFLPLFSIPIKDVELKKHSIKPSKILYYQMREALPLFEHFHAWIQRNITIIPLARQQAYFESYQKQLYFFSNLEGDYFYLDGSDVYNMNVGGHKKLAKEYQTTLLALTQELKELLDNDATLAAFNQSNLGAYYFRMSTFEDYFNNANANFGWDWLEVAFQQDYDAIIFEENDLYGIKRFDQTLVVPPTYDHIATFDESGLATICINNTYGLISKKGEIVLQPVWDNIQNTFIDYVEDEFGNVDYAKSPLYCVLSKENKYGVYNVSTQTEVLPFEYNDISYLFPRYYNVLQDGLYALHNLKGEQCIAPVSQIPFQNNGSFFYGTNVKGNVLYSHKYAWLGNFNYNAITDLYNGEILLVPSPTHAAMKALMNDMGDILLDAIRNAECVSQDAYIVVLESGKSIYSISKKELLIPAVKGNVNQYGAVETNLQYGQVYLSSGQKKGIYDTRHVQWAIPMQKANNIVILNEDYYAVENENTWSLALTATIDTVVSKANFITKHRLDGETDKIIIYQDNAIYVCKETPSLITNTELMALHYKQRYNNELERDLFIPYFESQLNTFTAVDYQGLEKHEVIEVKNHFLAEEFHEAYNQLLEYATQLQNDELLQDAGYRYLTEEDHIDYPKAFSHFEQASALGNPYATNNMGYMYEKGLHNQSDMHKAIACYTLAAERGNTQSNFNLGYTYYFGAEGIDIDFEQALNHFKKIENNPDFDVIHYIADCYYLLDDYKNAIRYCKKDIKQNNRLGSYLLGNMYRYGYGVKQDTATAIEYFEQAIAQDNNNAILSLIDIYAYQETFSNQEKLNYYIALAKERELEIPIVLADESLFKKTIRKLFQK